MKAAPVCRPERLQFFPVDQNRKGLVIMDANHQYRETDLQGNTATALQYALKGWHVFPLRPKLKEPATRRGFYDATTNPATIRRWFDNGHQHNIGIRTGTISGIAVLDSDGDVGGSSLRDLEFEHGGLPATLTSITGKGLHRWFSLCEPLPSSIGRIGDHIDLRADGGYVVAPGSVHPNGKIYAWIDDTIPLAPIPEWLSVLARKPKPASVSERALSLIKNPNNSGAYDGAYGRVALDREISDLAAAPAGTRNSALNRTAFKLFQLVAGGELARDLVIERLIDACHANRLIEDDGWPSVMKTIHSGQRAGLQHPRARSGGA
jgi:Bifunctional DNA primase/polymerase, N-terminal